MSSHFSAGSEDSISDSKEQDCESLPNAKPTQPADESSPSIGPVSRSTKTSPDSMPDGSEVMAFTQNQRDEVRDLKGIAGALAAEPGMKQTTYLFTLSVADSLAKTSQSPDHERDLMETEASSSTKPHESQTLFSGMEDGSLLRTYPDYFPATVAETLPPYSRRWPNSGFTTSHGECWTADTSECPNGGGGFSSLPDVLEATVPDRFYLSPKAAAGILRRAAKRGRELPPALMKALTDLAKS